MLPWVVHQNIILVAHTPRQGCQAVIHLLTTATSGPSASRVPGCPSPHSLTPIGRIERGDSRPTLRSSKVVLNGSAARAAPWGRTSEAATELAGRPNAVSVRSGPPTAKSTRAPVGRPLHTPDIPRNPLTRSHARRRLTHAVLLDVSLSHATTGTRRGARARARQTRTSGAAWTISRGRHAPEAQPRARPSNCVPPSPRRRHHRRHCLSTR